MRNYTGSRPIFLLLLAIALFALLGAQSQCSQVSDDVSDRTGALVRGGGDEDCYRDCDELYGDLQRDERDTFRDNIERCLEDADDREDSGTDVVACLQAEAQRHLDALQDLASAHLDCIAECGGFDSFRDCIGFCEDHGKRQTKDEDKIHKKILKACRIGGSPDGDGDPACEEQEHERHAQALEQIEIWVGDCADRCHDQGGGGGGQ